jgi:hypothetical protein
LELEYLQSRVEEADEAIRALPDRTKVASD